MDGDNAFNRLNRLRALHEVMLHHPAMFPFLYSMYKEDSNGRFSGLTHGIKPIITSEGVTQGDTLGSTLIASEHYRLILESNVF